MLPILMSCFVHTVSFLIFFNSFYLKLIYLFLAVLGLHCCSRASSSCYKRGLLFVVVHGPVPVLVSLAAERGLWGTVSVVGGVWVWLPLQQVEFSLTRD